MQTICVCGLAAVLLLLLALLSTGLGVRCRPLQCCHAAPACMHAKMHSAPLLCVCSCLPLLLRSGGVLFLLFGAHSLYTGVPE